MTTRQYFRDGLASLRGRPSLEALLTHASPDQPLAVRVAWIEDLLSWVRRDVPAKRLQLLMQFLDRQPDTHRRVAQTLRSIVRDSQALDLFADTGLPQGAGFTHELLSRLAASILPAPPETRDLADIFDRLFPRESRSGWLEQLDAELASRIIELFHHGETEAEGGWVFLRTDLEDAMIQLGDRICVVGSSREVRARLGNMAFRELPFQKLTPAIEALLANRAGPEPRADLAVELNRVRGVADACDRAVDDVIEHLEKSGVSTVLAYDIERLRAQVRRLELLLEAWSTPSLTGGRTLAIISDLVRQNHARRSVHELWRQNLHLLTRRIVERNAETGEHYVARNGREYADMLLSAAGGGMILGVTTIVKLLLAKLVLPEFFRGAFFGLNYALSFVAVQLCGFSVATKQPATTAPALARRMNSLHTPAQLESLVDEVVFLIRSQIASVFGNLILVIPAVWILDVVWTAATGDHIANEHKAELILGTVSPWSGCWFYAMFTGVLLWVSSLFAAWLDNWFVMHHLGPALAEHRRLQRFLGPTRTRHLAVWFRHNIAALGGNISLGLMLGIIPSIAVFFGVPLDVRHVTLSTGQVTAAFATLGGDHFWVLSTVWIALGLAGVGLLNVFVSFGLAIFVAVRARNLRGPERHQFYRAIISRFLRSPLSFMLPIGGTASPKAQNEC